MPGSVTLPNTRTGVPDADTMAQPTSGCTSSMAYMASSEPAISLPSSGPTVSGHFGGLCVNLFAARAITMTRMLMPSVMCTATKAPCEPISLVMVKPISSAAKTATAVSQCSTRVRIGKRFIGRPARPEQFSARWYGPGTTPRTPPSAH